MLRINYKILDNLLSAKRVDLNCHLSSDILINLRAPNTHSPLIFTQNTWTRVYICFFFLLLLRTPLIVRTFFHGEKASFACLGVFVFSHKSIRYVVWIASIKQRQNKRNCLPYLNGSTSALMQKLSAKCTHSQTRGGSRWQHNNHWREQQMDFLVLFFVFLYFVLREVLADNANYVLCCQERCAAKWRNSFIIKLIIWMYPANRKFLKYFDCIRIE